MEIALCSLFTNVSDTLFKLFIFTLSFIGTSPQSLKDSHAKVKTYNHFHNILRLFDVL